MNASPLSPSSFGISNQIKVLSGSLNTFATSVKMQVFLLLRLLDYNRYY